MKKMKFFILASIALFELGVLANAQTITPLPSKAQLAWHEQEFYLFAHFGPNTFTNKEWGHGDEPEDVFNPTALDCRQWCRIAKAAGAKGIIITAKHHDGFCLWPSKFSKHTVRESKWKNGKGDVLKELSMACKEYGLKFGVYLSPWDRNHPDYGTEKYNDAFVSMMKEVFTNYGPIWEFWWDGANGEGPNGKKQVYDWPRFRETIKKLSPNTVVFSDVGPHIRWVGNEQGIAGETNWNTLDTVGFTAGAGAPPVDTLNTGNENGKAWIPAECDVSIRPGWFYHAEEDDKVKTSENLFQLYLKSVGRGANLLLNVPPDRNGLIHTNDSAALIDFNHLRENSFGNNLLKNSNAFILAADSIPLKAKVTDNQQTSYAEIKEIKKEALLVHFKKREKINCVVIKEAILYGQSVRKFYVEIRTGKALQRFMATTIGRKRIITFPAMDADDVMVLFLASKGKIRITEVEAYLMDEKLIAK